MLKDDRIHTLKVIAISRHPFLRGVELYIRGYGFKEGIYDLKSVEWQEVSYSESPTESFMLSYETAQELMNSLWECGLRPAQGVGSVGQLEATKAHLDDLRKIAFKFLELDNE